MFTRMVQNMNTAQNYNKKSIYLLPCTHNSQHICSENVSSTFTAKNAFAHTVVRVIQKFNLNKATDNAINLTISDHNAFMLQVLGFGFSNSTFE